MSATSTPPDRSGRTGRRVRKARVVDPRQLSFEERCAALRPFVHLILRAAELRRDTEAPSPSPDEQEVPWNS